MLVAQRSDPQIVRWNWLFHLSQLHAYGGVVVRSFLVDIEPYTTYSLWCSSADGRAGWLNPDSIPALLIC
jgi:hypothetical protein